MDEQTTDGRHAPCGHDPYRRIDGFCWACWEELRAQRRTARRSELQAALEAGKVIVEQAGASLCEWTTAGVTVVDGNVRRSDQPFTAECMTPAHLAEHLESRESGFCWTLTIR